MDTQQNDADRTSPGAPNINRQTESLPSAHYCGGLLSGLNIDSPTESNATNDHFIGWNPMHLQEDVVNQGYTSPFGTFGGWYGSGSLENSPYTTENISSSLPGTGIHDYLTSLSQPESNSDNASEASGSYAGGHYASNIDGLSQVFSMSDPVDRGSDLYGESYNAWATDNVHFNSKQYDPFKTTGVFNTEEPSDEMAVKRPLKASKSAPIGSGKLSYSDVAKNKPNMFKSKPANLHTEKSTPSVSPPSGLDYMSQAGLEHQSFASGSMKATHKKIKVLRANHRPKSASHLDTGNLKPDSRYGLDTFEDPSLMQRQSSKETNSCSQSRKNSTSSIGSGSSGVEEIQLPHRNPGNVCNAGDIPSPSVGLKYDLHIDDISDQAAGCERRKSAEKSSQKADKNASYSNSEKVFFDPKRIFGTTRQKSVKKDVPNNQNKKADIREDTILNNGKPTPSYASNCGMNKTTAPNYINNNLKEHSKQTNTESQHNSGIHEDQDYNRSSFSQGAVPDNNYGRRPGSGINNRTSSARSMSGKKAIPDGTLPPSRRTKQQKQAQLDIGGLLFKGWEWTKWGILEVVHIVWNLAALVLKLTWGLILLIAHYIIVRIMKFWTYINLKIFGRKKQATGNGSSEEYYDWSNPSSQSKFRTHGLEDNINLPATGEEAMKRLLSCKGKDPYSILGVRSDASDDDIKKYYRKQAVLVHPDKNQQPGAEEAFKILGHAIELIGEPEKRKLYDAQRTEKQDTEVAMQEFADLLTKLHEKMQEAANTMRCDSCGGKHRRIPTDRPKYSARFCDRCNTRHSAKEGDVWAETSYMGFRWHYYACMENKVFNITEWAVCKQDKFKHIQANSHQVIYRIATNGGRQQQHNRSGEADLEDFINHMFNQASQPEASGGNYGYPPQDNSAKPQSHSGWNQNTTGNTKKRRGKKKRH